MVSIGLNIAQANFVVQQIKDLLSRNYEATKVLIEKNPHKCSKILDDLYFHGLNKLSEIESPEKRLKQLKTSATYIEPQEKSTGYTWERKVDIRTGQTTSITVPSTFQEISIRKTLTALFSDESFAKAYVDFNQKENSRCNESCYTSFRSGSVYKNSEFFRVNHLAIQIRLFTDDFEPCDPLKSKAGVHKITAFYFQINNLPNSVLSKTRNIYLVALNDSKDNKHENTDAEIVIETIMRDIKSLEMNGITTCNGLNLKATLATVLFDNLGGNVLYGLSGGFNSNYYCRMCSLSRNECQQSTEENAPSLRIKSEYDDIIQKLRDEDSLVNASAKGIKSYCLLNDLDHFHILDNFTVDPMHDLFEGLTGFTIEHVINYGIENKIFSLNEVQNLVKCYNYGSLSRQDIPSKLNMDKKNLGQNASQAQCLFSNIPYILYKFREGLEPVWLCVESLLQIICIVMSRNISPDDVNRLRLLIKRHLNSFQECFAKPLKPKHHFLTHYPTVIQRMGPVIDLWTKRMEAKHQYFKSVVRKTKNFINLKKTLAYKHQEKFFLDGIDLSDEVILGVKKVPFTEANHFNEYYGKLNKLVFTPEKIDGLNLIKSFQINDRKYKSGYLLVSGSHFVEIENIMTDGIHFWFLCCSSLYVKRYDAFLNSLALEVVEDSYNVISFSQLEINKPIEKKILECEFFISVENLEIYNIAVK